MINPDQGVKECFLFDAGNTLIRLHPNREEILKGILVEHGLEVTPGQLKLAFTLNDDNVDMGGFTTLPKEERRRFWGEYAHDLLKTMEQPTDDLESISESISERFCSPNSWRPFSDVVRTLEKLRGSGCTLGVVSNAEVCLRRILEENQLTDYFDTIIISEEVGVEKPDGRIFHEALDRLNSEPERCVHVGDIVEADVNGARSVGITPVWLDRDSLGKYTPELIKTHTLMDIPAMFRLPDDWRL